MARIPWTGRRLRVLIGIVCGCAFSLFGYDQALYGGIASGAQFTAHFNHPSPSLTGHIAAVYDLGNLAGAIAAMYFAHRMGHRKSVLLGSMIVVVGTILQTSAVNVAMLMVGRVIGGIGNGINTSIVPVYHSESSRSLSRGRAVIGELFILDVGWLIAQFLTLGFSFVSNSAQWRAPTAFQILYLVPVFALVPFLPESPRWLASRKRYQEAAQVLAQLEGDGATVETPSILAKLEELKEIAELEHAGESTSLKEIWTSDGRNFYRLMLACGVQVLAQIGGINIIAYYVVIIFEQQLGLGSTLARILAACAGIGWLFSNIFSMTVIERWGRRPLLLFGSFGQGVCFLVSGVVLATTTGSGGGAVVVAMIYLYFVIFAFAWQAIPFLYPAEILSLKYRNRFYGLANGCNWAINYVVVLITPIGLANLGWRFYLVFMVFNFITIFIVYFFFVETARKSLEEIDLFFLVGRSDQVLGHQPLGLRLTTGNNPSPNAVQSPKNSQYATDEKSTIGTVEHIQTVA